MVHEEDQDKRFELGEGAGYSVLFEGDLIRVWDASWTRLIHKDRLVDLCIPNHRPK